jgi:hypothetical protein
MKILHLLRRPPDPLALEVISEQGRRHDLCVVALHPDAGDVPRLQGVDLLMLQEDQRDRTIGFDELVRLIFEHDKVFCW